MNGCRSCDVKGLAGLEQSRGKGEAVVGKQKPRKTPRKFVGNLHCG